VTNISKSNKSQNDSMPGFLSSWKISKFGTLLSGSGIRKLQGAKPFVVLTAIFTFQFRGVNFPRVIVNNREMGPAGCRLKISEEPAL